MLKYLPYLIQALFMIGGLSLGLWLKSGSAPGASSSQQETIEASSEAGADAAGASDEGGKKKHAGKSKKSGGHGKAGADDTPFGYMKFSRQFVVPVVGSTGVNSLVVMDINIEVPPEVTESVYAREPKLRDAVLGALLSLSNTGAFNNDLLDKSNIDKIRAQLLEAAQSVIGKDAQNVLILSIARQDV